MPLSKNEQVNQTAGQLVEKLRTTFGTPKDYRPAHARGQLAKGTFTPTKEAAILSTAQIFHQPQTPLIVRFSSSTGIKDIPDSDSSSNPRGFAIRFVLSEDGHQHYDIITHSANGFPVRTGEEFLEMLNAITSGAVGKFASEHPAFVKFGQSNPGFPKSFATEQFFGVNAFKFSNEEGKSVFFRYRLKPEHVEHISNEQAEAGGPNYLYDELNTRLAAESPIKYQLLAQIAEAEDVTDDATQVWPEERDLVTLGHIEIEQEWNAEENGGTEQKRIIYDPVPRQITGIEASNDPLIDMRAAVYLMSGKQRRAASGVQ